MLNIIFQLYYPSSTWPQPIVQQSALFTVTKQTHCRLFY